MFLGQYEHAMDEKGRISIPARFRTDLEQGAYITQGFDQNLLILPADSFERMYTHVNQMSITNPDARQLKRLIFSHADRVEFDRSGRILIPQFLRDIAGLQGTVAVVGAGAYIELWSPDNWHLHEEQLADPGLNNERYAPFNLMVE